MQGPRHPIVAITAGADATALAFAPLNLWPLGLIGLALFAHLVITAGSGWAAAARGWLVRDSDVCRVAELVATSFTYQAKMPAALGWVAVIGLSMYLALFVALPAGLAVRLAEKSPWRVRCGWWRYGRWAETLRGTLLTGFAWNPAGGAIWLGNAGGAAGIGGRRHRAFDAGAGLRRGAALAGPQSRPLAGGRHWHAGRYRPAGAAGRQHDHRK